MAQDYCLTIQLTSPLLPLMRIKALVNSIGNIQIISAEVPYQYATFSERYPQHRDLLIWSVDDSIDSGLDEFSLELNLSPLTSVAIRSQLHLPSRTLLRDSHRKGSVTELKNNSLATSTR